MAETFGNVRESENMLNKATTDTAELKMPLWKANMWFCVLWAMLIMDFLDRYALSATLPIIKKTYQLSDTQAGMLGSIFAAAIVIFVIPTGIIAYKWSRRKVCAIMVASWSLATWTTGHATGYFTLLAARFGVGVGEAGYTPLAYTLISTWYPQRMRGKVLALFWSGTQVGSTIGLAVAGWLTVTYGWQACFGILAVPGLILAVIGWFMPDFKNELSAKDKERANAVNSETTIELGIKDALAYTLKSPAVLYAYLIAGCFSLGITTMTTWGVTMMVRTYKMGILEASSFLGGTGVLAMLVPIIVGWVADRLREKSKVGRLTTSYMSVIGYVLLMLIFAYNSINVLNLVVAFVCYGIAKGLALGGQANINVVVQDLLPPHYRSVSNSIIPVSQSTGGMVGPVLCGVFSDAYGIDMALAYISILVFTLVIIFTKLCKKYYGRDLEKLEKLGHFNLERV